jgi:hypothetical protein
MRIRARAACSSVDRSAADPQRSGAQHVEVAPAQTAARGSIDRNS